MVPHSSPIVAALLFVALAPLTSDAQAKTLDIQVVCINFYSPCDQHAMQTWAMPPHRRVAARVACTVWRPWCALHALPPSRRARARTLTHHLTPPPSCPALGFAAASRKGVAAASPRRHYQVSRCPARLIS